jgi:hypothetical protein
MGKTLGLFVAALFLTAQWLVQSHVAAHGSVKHEHHGKTCDVHLHSEQFKYAPVAFAAVPPAPGLFFSFASTPTDAQADLPAPRAASPRAPPAFLFG